MAVVGWGREDRYRSGSPLLAKGPLLRNVSRQAPALASCIILLFLETWNEFIYALVFLQNPEIQTIPVAIARIAGGKFRLPLGTYGAAIMITVIPVLIVFILFQKWFIAGMTMGAVKG